MRISKFSVGGSPYIGVFCLVTEDIALLPQFANRKEMDEVNDILGVEAVKASVAESVLIGALSVGVGKKVLLPETATNEEIKQLESLGLKTKQVYGPTALGNIVAVGSEHGIASKLLREQQLKETEKFFGVKFTQMELAGTDIPGSCLRITDKGFIAHSGIVSEDFQKLKRLLKVTGSATTANYGDPFVGNSVLANSHGILVGEFTSGIEIQRIDEGLGGAENEHIAAKIV